MAIALGLLALLCAGLLQLLFTLVLFRYYLYAFGRYGVATILIASAAIIFILPELVADELYRAIPQSYKEASIALGVWGWLGLNFILFCQPPEKIRR